MLVKLTADTIIDLDNNRMYTIRTQKDNTLALRIENLSNGEYGFFGAKFEGEAADRLWEVLHAACIDMTRYDVRTLRELFNDKDAPVNPGVMSKIRQIRNGK